MMPPPGPPQGLPPGTPQHSHYLSGAYATQNGEKIPGPVLPKPTPRTPDENMMQTSSSMKNLSVPPPPPTGLPPQRWPNPTNEPRVDPLDSHVSTARQRVAQEMTELLQKSHHMMAQSDTDIAQLMLKQKNIIEARNKKAMEKLEQQARQSFGVEVVEQVDENTAVLAQGRDDKVISRKPGVIEIKSNNPAIVRHSPPATQSVLSPVRRAGVDAEGAREAMKMLAAQCVAAKEEASHKYVFCHE